MTDEIIEQTKTCAKCGETKPVKTFYPLIVGFSDNCRKCRKPMSTTQVVVGNQKLCSNCETMKAFSEFSANPSSSSGLTSRCKKCCRKSWRKRHPIRADRIAMPLPNEEWRPVVGFEDEFSVSNLGRVRRDKGMKRTFANRLLKLHLSSIGYYTVALHGRTTLVHRLVAEAFIPIDPSRPHVNHKSGIRTENHVSNLEWVTHTENMEHAARNFPSRTRKLNHAQVKEIRKRFSDGVIQAELARSYGVRDSTIASIVNKRWWRHVV